MRAQSFAAFSLGIGEIGTAAWEDTRLLDDTALIFYRCICLRRLCVFAGRYRRGHAQARRIRESFGLAGHPTLA